MNLVLLAKPRPTKDGEVTYTDQKQEWLWNAVKAAVRSLLVSDWNQSIKV